MKNRALRQVLDPVQTAVYLAVFSTKARLGKHLSNTHVSILCIGQSSVGLWGCLPDLFGSNFLTPNFKTWSKVNIHPELSTINFLALVFTQSLFSVACEGLMK